MRLAARSIVLLLAAVVASMSAFAATKTVTITNFTFTPRNLTVAPGDTVMWVWETGFHSTTSDLQENSPEVWDSGANSAPFSYSHAFDTPGAYRYYCMIHGSPGAKGMSGTITVSGGTPAPAVTGFTPQSGPASGGTAVTITGTGFQQDAAVSFGGTAAASQSFVSATQIDAVTPAHAAGTVPVTVTNPDNQSGTFIGFTFVAEPPAVTGFTPSSGIAGTDITVYGNALAGIISVRIGGLTATFRELDGTSLVFSVPAGASSGKISVQTAVGTATSSQDFTVARPKRGRAASR